MFARHPCFELVLSCCLCQCCTHDSPFLLSPHFAHGSGAPGYSVLIHGSTLCRQLKSCFRDWSISSMKPCRQDNDKVQRNRRWQWPNNVSSSYPQEAVHLHRQLESSTRAHWASRTVHWSASGIDNLAIHVQGIRGCGASEDARSLRLVDTERHSSCGQQ